MTSYQCDQCGKTSRIEPDLRLHNGYPDLKHFCSDACLTEWMAKVFPERVAREATLKALAKARTDSVLPFESGVRYIIRHTLNQMSEWKAGMRATYDDIKGVYRTEAKTEDELRSNLACDHCNFVRITRDPVYPEEQCAWFEEEGLVD